MSWAMRLMGVSNLGEVDPNGQQRTILYDFAGNLVTPANRAALLETTGGLVHAGKDYKLSRTLRASSIGNLQLGGDETFMLLDAFEGTTRNLNQWIETIATAVSSQTVAVGLTLNSGNSVTSGQGVLESSNRQFPLVARASLVFRARLRLQGTTNCFEEFGFSDQASATTALHNNGVFFRRDGAGSLQPILAFNGVETAGSTMSGVNTTDYNWFEIWLEDDRATFQVFSVSGVLLASQVMERGATGAGAGAPTQARMFVVTHLPAMLRVYNSGAAGTAPQIVINHCSVTFIDGFSQRDHEIMMAGMGYDGLTSPTAFTQLANFANSADPASATLSNTAAGYTTLGGKFQFVVLAGAVTDYALFGWQNPSPYTFYCRGISISQLVVKSLTTGLTAPIIIAWGAAFNSSAVSLATAAPYSPMKLALGQQSRGGTAVAAVGDTVGGDIYMQFMTPKVVQPGKFLHLIMQIPILAVAGTTCVLYGHAAVDGFFE